ncbi:hypothetical protein PSENEW3_00001313 [Picochlorum sp. SENEW3]|nr:hypothetical protein PSENEW3_00001313 [Picochlorum sp. SENEW3]
MFIVEYPLDRSKPILFKISLPKKATKYAKIHVNAIQTTAHVARTALAALQSWVALAAKSVKTAVHVAPIASVAMGAVERLNVKMMI